jgi:hypothetical protein
MKLFSEGSFGLNSKEEILPGDRADSMVAGSDPVLLDDRSIEQMCAVKRKSSVLSNEPGSGSKKMNSDFEKSPGLSCGKKIEAASKIKNN